MKSRRGTPTQLDGSLPSLPMTSFVGQWTAWTVPFAPSAASNAQYTQLRDDAATKRSRSQPCTEGVVDASWRGQLTTADSLNLDGVMRRKRPKTLPLVCSHCGQRKPKTACHRCWYEAWATAVLLHKLALK